MGLARYGHNCEYTRREGNAVHGQGLHKGSMHRGHGLAAILTMFVAVRRARHRVAALHRLFRRRRGAAVECISRESDCEHHDQNWLGKAHHGVA